MISRLKIRYLLTNIHDQPSFPPTPSMKEIPKVSRPENAPVQNNVRHRPANKMNMSVPAIVAPPQKTPMRYCNMWRGYHMERLNVKVLDYNDVANDSNIHTTTLRPGIDQLLLHPARRVFRPAVGSCVTSRRSIECVNKIRHTSELDPSMS